MKELTNNTNGNQTTYSPSMCDDCSNSGIPELSTLGEIFVGIITCILILVSFCGNAVVCFIVYRKPQMRSAINLLLANMALSDILVSILCMPFPFITLLSGEWLFGHDVCEIHNFLLEYLSAVAILILLIMSGDRYMIIVKRRDKLTAKFSKLFIALVWVIPCVIALLPITGLGNYKLQHGHIQCSLSIANKTYDLAYLVIKFSVNFLCPSIIMGYSFIGIGNAVRTNLFRVRNNSETDVSLSIAQMSAKLGFVMIPMENKVNIDVKFKTRTFKTIMLLYFVMFICMSPYSINQLVSNITDMFHVTTDTVLLVLAFSKSAINPVIYFFRIKKFREACGEFIPESCKCRIRTVSKKSNSRVNPSALYLYQVEQSTNSVWTSTALYNSEQHITSI